MDLRLDPRMFSIVYVYQFWLVDPPTTFFVDPKKVEILEGNENRLKQKMISSIFMSRIQHVGSTSQGPRDSIFRKISFAILSSTLSAPSRFQIWQK